MPRESARPQCYPRLLLFLQRVPGILKQVIAEERLGQLPLFAFGASSGGGFVLRLAQAMPEVQVRAGRKCRAAAHQEHSWRA